MFSLGEQGAQEAGQRRCSSRQSLPSAIGLRLNLNIASSRMEMVSPTLTSLPAARNAAAWQPWRPELRGPRG